MGDRLLATHKPVQCLFPILEGDDLALRKVVEVIKEGVRDFLGSNPSRLFHKRPVEREYFFDLHGDGMVDFRIREIGKGEQ